MAKIERDDKGLYIIVADSDGTEKKIYIEDDTQKKQQYAIAHNEMIEAMYKRTIENTKKLREQKGLTQQEFSDKCALSKNFISAVENGRSRVSAEVLINFAYTLGVPVSALVEDDGNLNKIDPVLQTMISSLSNNNVKMVIDFVKKLTEKQEEVEKYMKSVKERIDDMEVKVKEEIDYMVTLSDGSQTMVNVDIVRDHSERLAMYTKDLSVLREKFQNIMKQL